MRRTGSIVGLQFLGAAPALDAPGNRQTPRAIQLSGGARFVSMGEECRSLRPAQTQAIYPGINAIFYYQSGQPRYDLALAPGADPARIRMRYTGARSVTVGTNGDLVIATDAGNLVQHGLYAYQRIDGNEVSVPCSFHVGAKGMVGFTVGPYDHSQQLVIDPLLYSSYLGGSGDDGAYAVAVDGSGMHTSPAMPLPGPRLRATRSPQQLARMTGRSTAARLMHAWRSSTA